MVPASLATTAAVPTASAGITASVVWSPARPRSSRERRLHDGEVQERQRGAEVGHRLLTTGRFHQWVVSGKSIR